MTEPYHACNLVTLHHGDCLAHLRDMPDNSVDAIVTDPPYGLSNTGPDKVADTIVRWASGDREHVPEGRGFMGRPWDAFVPPPAVWDECLRVLKPGGHMAVFAGARTQDLMGLSIRLAGFEIRDTLGWVYGSGMPKSLDVSKAIDKAAGAEREVVGPYVRRGDKRPYPVNSSSEIEFNNPSSKGDITTPASDAAKQWDGWGTAVKPAWEPILLARKPLDGTVAANVLAHGVGGLNIDACRVPSDTPIPSHHGTSGAAGVTMGKYRDYVPGSETAASVENVQTAGRWPANVLLDECAAKEMDRQSGWSKSPTSTGRGGGGQHGTYSPISGQGRVPAPGDSGGASRFFPVFKYQAKAPKKERPVIEREDGTKVQHCTVKPLALTSWLVTLIAPPGGVVLDPFAGSGTTLQAARDKGFRAIGVEADAEHCELIVARLAKDDGGLFAA